MGKIRESGELAAIGGLNWNSREGVLRATFAQTYLFADDIGIVPQQENYRPLWNTLRAIREGLTGELGTEWEIPGDQHRGIELVPLLLFVNYLQHFVLSEEALTRLDVRMELWLSDLPETYGRDLLTEQSQLFGMLHALLSEMSSGTRTFREWSDHTVTRLEETLRVAKKHRSKVLDRFDLPQNTRPPGLNEEALRNIRAYFLLMHMGRTYPEIVSQFESEPGGPYSLESLKTGKSRLFNQLMDDFVLQSLGWDDPPLVAGRLLTGLKPEFFNLPYETLTMPLHERKTQV